MSTFDSSWILIAGLAAFVAWLGWTVLRTRRGSAEREPSTPPADGAAAKEEVAVVEAPAERLPVQTPAPAPAAREAPAPAPRPMEAIPATRGRPPVPRIEGVLAFEPGSVDADADTDGDSDGGGGGGGGGHRAGAPLPLPSPLAETVSRLLAGAAHPHDVGAGRASGLVVCLPADAAVRIAHGDLVEMRALAAANEDSTADPRPGLDSVAAAELAAVVLAAQAEPFLRALGEEVQDLKAAFAAIPVKTMGGHDAALRSSVQELTRYSRDAREGYATLVGKAAFRERVDAAAAHAGRSWREIATLAAATRGPLDALVETPRFGEVQIEKARALLHEHRQAQRVQAVAARALAAASMLRLLFGGFDGLGGALDPALHAAQADLAQDGVLQQRLRVAESGARGDPYVGRGEFEANRAALRQLLDGLGSDLADANERLLAARTAVSDGFPRGAGWRCTLRAADGLPPELRVRPA